MLQKKENEFQFNKDDGMYVCKAGNMAIQKAHQGKKNVSGNQQDCYYFDTEECKKCPLKDGCYREGAESEYIKKRQRNVINLKQRIVN